MLSSLLLTAALTPAAPIPKDTLPNTTGPAPRVLAVKADATGAVWVSGTVYEPRKVQQSYVTVENGQQVVKQREVVVNSSTYIRKSLADFGGKFTMADGTALTTDQATKRVKDGAVLLITADNKPVDKNWLQAVGGDTVVMFAEGLAHAQFHFGSAPMPMTPAPRLAMFCSDDKGAVRVPVNPNAANVNEQVYYDDFNGGGRVIRGKMIVQGGDIDFGGGYAPAPAVTAPGSDGKKALQDIKFDAYDVTGKMVSRNEALKRLKAGGLVLLAGDNRCPDAEYLKGFRDDILVLASGEFVFPANLSNPYDMPKAGTALTPPKPGQPAPPVNIVPPVALPAIGVAKPAVIKQVQVLPQIEK